MKKFIGALFLAFVFLTACTRNNDKPEELIQVQEIESENTAFHFKYNELDQLNRFEVWNKAGGDNSKKLYSYVAINYANGTPESADFFEQGIGGSLYRKTVATYHYTPLRRIKYTVFTYFEPDGSPLNRKNDTLDLQFDSNNRIISIGWRGSYLPENVYSYDAQGNLIQLEQNISLQSDTYKYTHQHSYDSYPNPFAANGTGTTLCILYFNEYFYPYELLSAKNPTYYKMEITQKSGSTSLQYEESSRHNNRYDAHGVLNGQTIIMSDNYNGTPSTDEIIYQFSCIKK